MECKFCHAQMDEETTVCPVCGQAQDEEIPETVTEPEEEAVLSEETAAPEEKQALPEEPAEAPKKKKTGMIIGIVAGCLAVAAIAVALVLLLRPKTPEGMGTTDISAKAVYTVEAADLAKNADYVVAQMGDKTLTVSQLQVFYWMEYYNFMSSYGSSAIYFGLDSTKPLSEQQSSMEEGKTWEQYFLEAAINSWSQFQSLAIQAEKDNFVLDEELQSNLNSLEENLTAQATENGFDTLDAMVQADFGPAATFADYQNYMQIYYTAYMYFNQRCEAVNPDEDTLSAYYDEHQGTFSEEGILKDNTPATVTVRHILISPEGGTTDENGQTTYSDEEWAAAEEKANTVYDEWKSGAKTEDSFAEMAGQYSTDPGSQSNGGLYQDVTPGQMVTEFNDWCFNPARTAGDTDIVKTQFGYHIMYFSSAGEELYWVSRARTEYMTEQSTLILDGAKAEYPAQVNYNAIVLGEPVQATEPEDTTPTSGTAPTDATTPAQTTTPDTTPAE